MIFREGLVYILRHAWFWPLEFWLRPLNVIERVTKTGQARLELACAMVSGVAWGTLASALLWNWMIITQPVSVLIIIATSAVAIAVAFAFAFVGTDVANGAFAINTAIDAAIIVAIFGVIINIFANIGTVSIFFSGIFAFVIAFSIIFTFTFICAVIISGVFASTGPKISIYAITISTIVVFIIAFIPFAISFHYITIVTDYSNIDASISTTASIVVLAIYTSIVASTRTIVGVITRFVIGFFSTIFLMAFLLLDDKSMLIRITILGLSLISGLVMSILASYHGSTTVDIQHYLSFKKYNQATWLIVFWIFFSLLTSAIWCLDFKIKKLDILNTKLDCIVLFSAFGASLLTGLVFWPLISLISLWQFHPSQVSLYNVRRFILTIPFRWQTFAYPLPGIRNYLTTLCLQCGPEIALKAIQTIQFRSLQTLAASKAALDLVTRPDTALAFCGQIAVTTNTATLLSISLVVPEHAVHAVRAVAVLTPKKEIEKKQSPQLIVEKLPAKQSWSEEEKFTRTRAAGLEIRLTYSLNEINSCQSYVYFSNFQTLLQTLSVYLHLHLQNIHNLSEKETKESITWIKEGWRILLNIEPALKELEIYRELNTSSARREFLEHKIKELRRLSWDGFSEYWGNIGKELTTHWINLLTEEAKQPREWLRLEVELTNEDLTAGQQILQFQISNPTATLARNIQISMDALPGLEWHHEAKRSLLEGGKNALMSLELEAHEQGRYRITGRLAAEDISGNPFSLPFAFQLNIAQAGHRYQLPDYQPYITGEGLGDDRTFAGRQDLLRWLRSLWLQPGGKAAVVLVGQRRIGKTSLLNKIKRDGLLDTRLLPVLINIQGVVGDYDFLNSIAREMAAYLKASKPSLDRDNPYPDFKDFLLSLKSKLDQQRFLLMLDEADLIPLRKLGDLLPGFLRALMQEPEYPTLLLFCGTHALKRVSLEYSSILFNTAQFFRIVSYMTAAESAEVLEKPARDILEFDPAVLDDAYRLTRGQPLLLQSLGATLINRFNAIVLEGGERSNYVNLNDLNKAADELVRQGNAAFENHWEDSDPATHRVLSALAWATDETNRLQLDLPGIEARMMEVRLALPAGAVFKIVERLADEEILLREGLTYRFAVPLYRRWIAWRWPPERVREEPLG